MNVVVLSLLIVVTVLAVGLWPVQLVRRHRGTNVSFRVPVMITLLVIDLWFWAVAFDSSLGAHRGLIAPLVIVNAVLAFGAIYGLTGTQMHRDVGGGRMGLFLGRDESKRVDGWDRTRR